MKKRFLFFFVITTLVLMNACQKEYSFENGTGLSQGTLQDDGAGDCLPKIVAGAYAAGVALNGTTNYIEVTVDVTTAGAYVIYTDTLNGMFFRGTGNFTTTGLNTVRLRGTGTPTVPGIDNFIVSYGTSGCTVAVTTSGALASFTLAGAPGNCTSATPAGTYTQGVALTSTNTVNINVDVTVAGAYVISTSTSNGMTFTASGVFTTTGPKTVVLTGTGTPIAAGATTIPVTAGSSSCSFSITVTPAAGAGVFTMNCATASANGTYTVGTALAASNTITVSVDVTTIGTYSITGAVGGMTFTGTGSFTVTGTQTLTLTGTGTPTTAGSNTIALTGGTAPCNNVNIVVNPAAGAATFTVNCATATVNGTYTVGTALAAANTILLPVTVTVAGTYTISATLNGMTFTASGNFAATGAQNVTLTGTGNPTTAGANSVPVTGGTGTCNVTVNVNPAAGGPATFTANCAGATVNGTYTVGTALTGANTILLPVNVTVAGTYTISATLNGMTFTASGNFAATGAQNVTLNGAGNPTTAGANSVPVTGGTGTCNVTVNVNPAAGGPATFTVNCAGATVNGTYTVGTALAGANTILLPVNVTVAGSYTISATLNGMTFTASGNFAATGAQNATLTGTGNPTTAGANLVPVTGGTGTCNVTVNVNPAAGGPATFTANCAGATINGTYTVGTALTGANTILLPVNVTVAGTYTINATLNGMSFAAAGTFAATGGQNVTLNGTGNPTTAGANLVPVTGGTGTCNVTVNVNPAVTGAVFTVDCTSAALNGYLTSGVPVAAINTIDVDVNVTTPGNYTITTTLTNGITYTSSGNFASAGTTTVTLTGSGTPTAAGTFNLPVASGTTPCTIQVIVDPNFGTWSFKVGTTTYSGTVYDATMDNTSLPPFLFFSLLGDNAAGNLFELDLVDVSAAIAAAEQYDCAVFDGTANAAGVYYDDINATTYYADPSLPTNTMKVTVTSHNTTTKTIVGTFIGKALLNGGATLVDVTNGTFTVTYP